MYKYWKKTDQLLEPVKVAEGRREVRGMDAGFMVEVLKDLFREIERLGYYVEAKGLVEAIFTRGEKRVDVRWGSTKAGFFIRVNVQ